MGQRCITKTSCEVDEQLILTVIDHQIIPVTRVYVEGIYCLLFVQNSNNIYL